MVLCDIDRAVAANRSTGVLTPRNPARIRKTRIVAELDRMGFDTFLTSDAWTPQPAPPIATSTSP
jgi:hypothetical protein